MGVLAPVGLLLGLLAIPIIVFYMLRLRRQEITVSSNLLWRQVTQDRQANAPWQRLRRNLLLLLQLLVLAGLVAAAARPFVFTSAPAAGNLVVVLDGSASMQATDGAGGGTRFAQAQGEARRLAATLSPGERMTVIWAGPGPVTAVAGRGSAGAIQAAIAGLAPGNGGADMAAALTLAAGAAAQLGQATVVVISDGALGAAALPAPPAPVQFVPVGSGGRNAAITGLVLRDAVGGPQLFASVANYDTVTATGLLELRVSNGTGAARVWDARQVALGPRGETTLTLADLPLDTALVTATLGVPDLLALDNTAWAVRAGAGLTTTLLVTAGNSFLEKGLALLPTTRVAKQAPGDYRPTGGYGLTVFDGYLPPTLPAGNLLLINPPPSALVPMSGTIEGPVVGAAEVNDPLLRYVDWSAVHIARIANVQTPPWARALVRTTGGAPLLLVGETEGRRIAVLPFDLHASDFPLLIAFPIQLTNLVNWLQPVGTVEAPDHLAAGAALALHPRPDAQAVVVTGPDGRVTTLPAGETVAFGDTGLLGLYTVQQRGPPPLTPQPPLPAGEGGQPPLTPQPPLPAGEGESSSLSAPEYFAVNLFNPVESDLAPQGRLNLAGGPEATPAPVAAQRPQEVWPWLLVVALGLLMVEWWVYNRGRAGVRVKRET